MNKWVYSSEQERNLKTYSMPHHGILLVFFFHVDIIKWCGRIFYRIMEYCMTWQNILPTTYIIFCDMVKYSLISPGIFCHITSMVCLEMKNGLLTLNMGLAKKVINNSIMWMFENIFANLTWCILSSLVQTMSKCLMFFDNNYNICSNVKMWRAPKSRGETHLRVSQSQVAELRFGSTLPASNSRKG